MVDPARPPQRRSTADSFVEDLPAFAGDDLPFLTTSPSRISTSTASGSPGVTLVGFVCSSRILPTPGGVRRLRCTLPLLTCSPAHRGCCRQHRAAPRSSPTRTPKPPSRCSSASHSSFEGERLRRVAKGTPWAFRGLPCRRCLPKQTAPTSSPLPKQRRRRVRLVDPAEAVPRAPPSSHDDECSEPWCRPCSLASGFPYARSRSFLSLSWWGLASSR